MTVTSTTVSLRPARARRRVGLRVKALLITVVPVLVLGLLSALILTAQRRSELDAISRSLSHSVASLLAASLDVQDLNLVDTQLRAAVSSPGVAFVDVRPAGEDLRFFTSDHPDSDWYLRARLDEFLARGDGTHLRVRDERAAAYRAALGTVGPGAPASVREHLAARAAALEATQGQVQAYEVTRLAVYETPSGARALRFAGEPRPAGRPLFDLVIGVTLSDLQGVLSRQLGLVLLACAGVAVLAALGAYRAVRGLVQAILAITEAAHHASLGRLGDPLEDRHLNRNDELRDLVSAIERLRVSLHLALSRLRPGGKGP